MLFRSAWSAATQHSFITSTCRRGKQKTQREKGTEQSSGCRSTAEPLPSQGLPEGQELSHGTGLWKGGGRPTSSWEKELALQVESQGCWDSPTRAQPFLTLTEPQIHGCQQRWGSVFMQPRPQDRRPGCTCRLCHFLALRTRTHDSAFPRFRVPSGKWE